MRTLRRTGLLVVLAAVVGSAATIAWTGTVPDLPVSYLFSPAGTLTPLRAGVAYRASAFPIALRVTPPDATWGGAQWKANLFSPEEIAAKHLTCSTNPGVCKGPFFGWVTLGQGDVHNNIAPRDLIVVLTSFARTPSVAATVESLRSRGHGATYEATEPVKLAGFSGIQFDGRVVGRRHVFIPFSPPTSKAAGYADGIYFEGSGPFRFDVLDVRGKTVVVFVSSQVLTPDQFAAVLPKTDAILGSLRFPATP
jgi:hypothetical protein